MHQGGLESASGKIRECTSEDLRVHQGGLESASGRTREWIMED